MAEYIEKDKARELVCEFCIWVGTSKCEKCEHPIDGVPAADVAPVRRMEWKQGLGFPKYCSECGFMKHIAEKREYNFCPNCGARMDGES